MSNSVKSLILSRDWSLQDDSTMPQINVSLLLSDHLPLKSIKLKKDGGKKKSILHFLIYDDKMSKIVSEESFSSSIVATEQEATKAPNSASYSVRRLE